MNTEAGFQKFRALEKNLDTDLFSRGMKLIPVASRTNFRIAL
jgi:hypothetical protein